MNIVVDTNIVFSAILKPENNIGEILIVGNNVFNFLSTDLLKREIFKHQPKILQISKYSEVEFYELFSYISKGITFINEALISNSSLHKAIEYVKDIDINDALFVALAIETNSLLWTGDKALYKGLKSFGFMNVVSTNEIKDLYLEHSR